MSYVYRVTGRYDSLWEIALECYGCVMPQSPARLGSERVHRPLHLEASPGVVTLLWVLGWWLVASIVLAALYSLVREIVIRSRRGR